MATDRVRTIRGTRVDLGEVVRRQWIEAMDIHCEPLTFDDLEAGERFISFPLPGDNSGHGGLLSVAYVFTKIKPATEIGDVSSLPKNSIRSIDGNLSHCSKTMWVYKVQ
ncbi:MAG: hypothetical protein Q8Q89_04770 [bacterium]|nr:hypothetical protein [bacterium]